MSHRIRKLFTGVLDILAWVVFTFAVVVSLVGFLSQAVRTSTRQSFRGNIDVLIIGVAYIIVVGTTSSLQRLMVVTKKEKKKTQFMMTLAFCLKRRISMLIKLQRLSRGRIALRKGDIPKVRGGERGRCSII